MSTDEAVRRHCDEIDRCNQRGGRMLSIVDLIETETVSPELAAYLLAAIGGGASFMVGALPGGAGKTTVMGALLNFVPPDVELAPAEGLATIRCGRACPLPRRCYLCHEIGRGAYYAYLWGEALRAYFDLPFAGHILATNLHADTFEQARDQVCGDNGVSEEAFRRMGVVLFLAVRRGIRGGCRRVCAVWESDGNGPHVPVFDAASAAPLARSTALVSAEAMAKARGRIQELLSRRARTIEEVRGFLIG